MPRANRVLQSVFPYHVTLRSINKMDFGVEPSKLWGFSSDLLLFCTYAFKIEIHSFVLMSNHYHMILRTPEANLSQFMNYFNRELSREITYKTGRINQKFGCRYHSSIVSELGYYHRVYKYVYRNPVEAGICDRVEDFRNSSLNFILGREAYRFPVFDTYFESIDHHLPSLAWLNTPVDDLEKKSIKQGLKKPYFII